jgi:Uma2 family endonuclease
MVTQLPQGYFFDPSDPRAPTNEQWRHMSEKERAAVVTQLPAEVPLELMPPEGDDHRLTKGSVVDALGGFFQAARRKIYLSSELAVFYPGEARFAPDVLAVLDAEPHPRSKWVVADEGRGLDLVIEIHVAGSRDKDLVGNVPRYARLGIQEYFVFEQRRQRLHGFRLSPGAAPRAYQRIMPQGGRLPSEVLGLDLVIAGDKLRFWAGNARLEESPERIARLGSMLDEVMAHKEEAERAAEAALRQAKKQKKRAKKAQTRAAEEQRARVEALEARLAEEQRRREEAEASLRALEIELGRRSREG